MVLPEPRKPVIIVMGIGAMVGAERFGGGDIRRVDNFFRERVAGSLKWGFLGDHHWGDTCLSCIVSLPRLKL